MSRPIQLATRGRKLSMETYMVRVYTGSLSHEMEFVSIEAEKKTPASDVVGSVCTKLNLRAQLCELAEIFFSSGQICKERRLQKSENPVQVQLLWPKTQHSRDGHTTTGYRFYIRKKEPLATPGQWMECSDTNPIEENYLGLFIRKTSESKEYTDLCNLPDLNEKTLLKNLRARFDVGNIYTYVGSILIAVNPFKFFPIYNPKYVKLYQNRALGELPPHIFAIADAAFHTMLRDRDNQCIVISGESGSGKTESTNLLLHHLTAISQKGLHGSGVEQTILVSGPVLEAFGNAKTVHNNNSSRFGKYIQVNYKENGMVHGAIVEKYLLEKTRIVSQEANERNYHVFYYLLAGASEQEREQLSLTNVEDFHYLNQSKCYTLEDVDGEIVDEAHEFERLKQSMEIVGFSQETQRRLFAVLSAVLHIGNVEFKKRSDRYHHEAVEIKNTEVLTIISNLLRVKEATLKEALTTKKTVAGGESVIINYKMEEAICTRDAMAKCLYGALFDWIVLQINQALISKKDIKEHMGHSIGVLDIFGFEDFQKNSYEQFCINYANEHLQFYFNQHIFRFEQDEYQRESIEWKNIDFIDNTQCLQLFSAKSTGLFSLLDEECNFPGATDDTLLEKFHRQHKSNTYYEVPPVRESTFTIVHYAGKVKYMVKDFREKNSDLMRPDVVLVLKNSSLAFVRELVGSDPVAVLRWAIVRAFFRCYFAFVDAGKRYKEFKATRGSQQSGMIPRRHSWFNNRPEQPATTPTTPDGFSSPTALNNRMSCNRHSFTALHASSYNTSPGTSPVQPNPHSPIDVHWRASSSSSSSSSGGNRFNNSIIMKSKSFKPKTRPSKGLRDLKALKSVTGRRTLGKQIIPSKKQPPSVGAQFQYSLDCLMDNLERANPFFVRCIKSNADKAPCHFVDEIILRQLRYTGMLATVEIRRSGYNYRLTFDEFIQHYEILLPKGRLSSKVDVEKFLEHLDMNSENYQLGKSKVFLREREKILIDTALHNAIMKRVIMIQRWMKMHFERRNFLRMRAAALVIQSHVRSFLAQQKLCHLRLQLCATIIIQRWYRHYQARKRLRKHVAAAVNIQRWYRGYIARKRYVELLNAEMERRLDEQKRRRENEERIRRESEQKLAEERRKQEQEEQLRRLAEISEKKAQEHLIKDIHDEELDHDRIKSFHQRSKLRADPHSSISDEGILVKESSIEEIDIDLERRSTHTNDSEESSGILDDVSESQQRTKTSGMTPPNTPRMTLQESSLNINPSLVKFMSDDSVPSPIIKRARAPGSGSSEEVARPTPPPRYKKPSMIKSYSAGSVLTTASDPVRIGSRRMVAPLAKQESISDNTADKSPTSLQHWELSSINSDDSGEPHDESEGVSMSLTYPGSKFRLELQGVIERSQERHDLLNTSSESVNLPPSASGHRSALHRAKDRLRNMMGGRKHDDSMSMDESTAGTPRRPQDLGVAVLPLGNIPSPFASSPTKRTILADNDLNIPESDETNEFKENRKPKKRQGSRKIKDKDERDSKEAKNNWSKTGTQQWQYSNDLFVRDIDELEEIDKFIFAKLVSISEDCGRLDSKFDKVFKAALKDFHTNTLISLKSLAMQDKNNYNVKYRELMVNFEQVLQKNLELEDEAELDSSKTLALNAFRGFIDEFLKKRDQKRDDKPERKKKEKKKKKEEDVLEHLGHRFVVVQFNIPTFCELCNSLVWSIKEKGMSCQICKFTCHKKCLPRFLTSCKSSGVEVQLTGVFGVPLLLQLSESVKIPEIVERLISAIEINGLYTEGIYRKAGSAVRIKTLKKLINEDLLSAIDMLEEYPIHVLTAVMKAYYRELPEPLLTFELYDDFIRATDTGGVSAKEKVQSIYTVIEKLPEPNHDLFERLIFHLARVANLESYNKMSASNLAVVFAPCILRTNRPLQAQESLIHVTKQAVTIEMVISEQLSKLRSTIEDLNTLDNYTVTASEKLNNIQNNRKTLPKGATNPMLRRVATDINEEKFQLRAVDEEERALSRHLESIQREKDELTSNLPVLECRHGSSDEDMLYESEEDEEQYPATFDSPAHPPKQLTHLTKKRLPPPTFNRSPTTARATTRFTRSVSSDVTIPEDCDLNDDDCSQPRTSTFKVPIGRKGSYETDSVHDARGTFEITLDNEYIEQKDDKDDEIMV
ncbi:unconventional myosin-IXb-like isoform X2 [Tubulanus polymorphus]|uniref:unconventional myosin-IXb-like isoform X2 n=1 Tax=Tubulanus polymorphus TaxID=672921 RepID=UPI003DA41531